MFPAAILRENRKTQRESGVNALCLAEGYLLQDKNGEIRQSPILLTPLELQHNKVKGTINFNPVESAQFVNPYVEHTMLEHEIEHEAVNSESIFDFLQSAGFNIDMDASGCIGNFHHHRYTVLRELEALAETKSFSAPLQLLLGESKQGFSKTKLPADLLFPADVDHENVFQQIEVGPTVIQGPPGTGKSQVLTNVLGKTLASEYSSVVLSEKRVALEVLLQKLRLYGLDRLGFIVTSDTASRDLLKQLEENWHFFEEEEIQAQPNLRLSEQSEAQLQFSLDLLNQPDVVGGLSLYDFRKWMTALPQQSAIFINEPPSIPEVIEKEEILRAVYEKKLEGVVAHILPSTIQREDFELILETIRNWHKRLSELNEVVAFSTWADLRYITKQAVVCQKRENHREQTHKDLYKPNSRKQKRFFRLYKNWNRLKEELNQIPEDQIVWKKTPEKSDFDHLQKLSVGKSIFAKRKFVKLWKQFTDAPPYKADEARAYWEHKTELQAKKSQLIIDFCELGVSEPQKDVDLLHLSIQNYLNTEWEILEKLNPKQASYLTDSHLLLNESMTELGRLFALEDSTRILDFLQSFIDSFGELLALRTSLKMLGKSVLPVLSIAGSYDSYLAIIANSHWSIFRERFPGFSEFKMQDLHRKADAVISSQKSEARLFAQSILYNVQRKFRYYHEILNTPARKLSEENKELKKRLRKGKSILVKEFAKTRSHPSVRDLFGSEAREWIHLLTPLWFSNPTQVSKIFPLEKDLFDIAIFDEASQILLQNGLGALQRSKNGIIAGDSEQMGPTSYFKAGSNDTMDLLHQASFYWKPCYLRHHYRSLHPDLISFSNQHIYGGELKAYPAYNIKSPLHHHLVENGQFVSRRNPKEAEAVARHLEKSLSANESIGVVAFSEEQLECISESLSPEGLKKWNDRLDKETAFFKALENVQGDECDHLIISFGYGRNSDGEFAMRFGPMNTENGRRRLNVLLTRVRKRLDFFTSVSYNDFKLSDNESVNLLRLWFGYIETVGAASSVISLPLDTRFETNESELTLFEPNKALPSAREFVTFQQVMESRGWKLCFR